jgi:hypothetical protein
MWEGWYRIKDPEGKKKEYKKSLLENADFSAALGYSGS